MKVIALAAAVAALAAGPAVSQTHHHAHPSHAPATVAQATAATLADGEVRKVDKEGGKLTLKHADIKSLDMPAMTMVFAVKDKALLDRLKAGDKIRFKVVDDGGKLTLTEIQPAQ